MYLLFDAVAFFDELHVRHGLVGRLGQPRVSRFYRVVVDVVVVGTDVLAAFFVFHLVDVLWLRNKYEVCLDGSCFRPQTVHLGAGHHLRLLQEGT